MSASKSDSNSQQQSSQITTQIDNRIGVSENGIVAKDGSNVYVQRLDADILKQGLGLTSGIASKLASVANEVIPEALGVATKAVNQNTNLAKTAVTESTDLARDTNATVADVARDAVTAVTDVNSDSLNFAGDALSRFADVNADSLDFAAKALNSVVNANSDALETVNQNNQDNQALLDTAFERFGTDITHVTDELTSIKRAEITGGASESNKLIAYIIGGIVLLLGIFLFRSRKA